MPKTPIIEELPAGPTEGGGGRPLPHRPGWAELPAGPDYAFAREAANELFRLRDRVHAMETQFLATRLRIHNPNIHEIPRVEALSRVGLPNELPEGGEFGGGGLGGGGVGYHPVPWPGELPPWEQLLARNLEAILQRLSAVEAGLSALNTKVNAGG
ncbi:hypothetical protein [Paraburkholderia humisilvae]|uniref:Uncharacterized protein n=1 Tax=Paraburkholderia humisilvae TaxID=627669 RepID=A0A6J5D714_9BURK|nr:hypothetical protein [Paraburkholderia humisilvae]CAB3749171.1 hypothetical protein LMG29542_00908 [Paraburkholderia humisilvae]